MKIIFITNGGENIGGGHVSRMCALADAFLARGAQVSFLLNDGAPRIAEKFNPSYIDAPFENFDKCKSFIKNNDLCVIDSYDLTQDYLLKCSSFMDTLCIDDGGMFTFKIEIYAKWVLNYNLNAPSLPYEKSKARLLLGPQYALLKKGLEWSSESGDGVLFMSGSADIKQVSEQVIRWLAPEKIKLTVIVGPLVGGAVTEKIKAAAAANDSATLFFNPPNLTDVMSESALVICTSSVTCYEALALGRPVAVYQIADNQVPIGEFLAKAELGINLGSWGSWGKEELMSAIKNPPPQPPREVNPKGAQLAADTILKAVKNIKIK